MPRSPSDRIPRRRGRLMPAEAAAGSGGIWKMSGVLRYGARIGRGTGKIARGGSPIELRGRARQRRGSSIYPSPSAAGPRQSPIDSTWTELIDQAEIGAIERDKIYTGLEQPIDAPELELVVAEFRAAAFAARALPAVCAVLLMVSWCYGRVRTLSAARTSRRRPHPGRTPVPCCSNCCGRESRRSPCYRCRTSR